MFAWLNGPGRVFREPLQGSTNYLGAYNKHGKLIRMKNRESEAEEKKDQEEEENDEDEEEEAETAEEPQEELDEQGRKRSPLPRERASDLRPYPLNQYFKSESVLSEELRENIYKNVVENGQSVATVSAVWGVDMRRVAAVVRLKTIEKDWQRKGSKLATPYASAIMMMLPQTPYSPDKPQPHESINDLPVHPATRQQIFYPASESRQFTRVDAAKVFSPTLLPADERIAHPDLIQLERDIQAGVPRDERIKAVQKRDEEKRKKKEEAERKKLEWEQKNIKTVAGSRWDFKFQNVSVDDVGKDGRGRRGVGWRYGMPHEDRKRGQIKIPRSVE